MTTTTRDLDNALARLTRAMDAAGVPTAHLTLAQGSKTYGRAYRLHYRDADTGGLRSAFGTSDFLGMTRREAELSLNGMTAGLQMATACNFDTESSASRQHYIETGEYLRKGEAIES